MKRTLLAVLMVFVLMFTMAVPAAGAAGILDKVRNLKEKVETAVTGDEGPGEKYTVEKLVQKLLGYVEDKCRENNIEPEEAFEQVMGLITDEEGNIDLSTVLSLIGMFSGESSEGSTYMEEMNNRNETIHAYTIDRFKDTLEPGDVQVIGMLSILNEDFDTHKTIAWISLANYTVEGSDLKLKNYASSVEYLEFEVDENLNFTVSEAVPAEEGENYSASVDALCERLGVSREKFDHDFNRIEIEWEETYQMMDLMEQHPEYERIEYQGEMKTADEIAAINETLMDEGFAIDFADAETEETEETEETGK